MSKKQEKKAGKKKMHCRDSNQGPLIYQKKKERKKCTTGNPTPGMSEYAKPRLCRNHTATQAEAPTMATAHCFTLFQEAFDLPIAF